MSSGKQPVYIYESLDLRFSLYGLGKPVGIPTKARARFFQIGFGTKLGGPTWPYKMSGFTQNWAARSAFQIILIFAPKIFQNISCFTVGLIQHKKL